MKKAKKVISLLVFACMLMQILPVSASGVSGLGWDESNPGCIYYSIPAGEDAFYVRVYKDGTLIDGNWYFANDEEISQGAICYDFYKYSFPVWGNGVYTFDVRTGNADDYTINNDAVMSPQYEYVMAKQVSAPYDAYFANDKISWECDDERVDHYEIVWTYDYGDEVYNHMWAEPCYENCAEVTEDVYDFYNECIESWDDVDWPAEDARLHAIIYSVPADRTDYEMNRTIVHIGDGYLGEGGSGGGMGGGSSGGSSGGSGYPDRDSVADKYYDAAKVVYDLGFMTDVYAGPQKTVTREDISYLLIKLMGMESTAVESQNRTSFSDLTKGTYLNGCAYILKNKGIISGTASGTFAPDDEVTYIQAIKMLVDIMGYSQYASAMGTYPIGYLSAAARVGISSKVSLAQTDTVSRQELAQLAFNTLNAKLMEYSYTVNGPVYTITDETLLYSLGYEKYKGDIFSYGLTVGVTGKKYSSSAPLGTDVNDEILSVGDNDLYGYRHSAMELYALGDEILSALPLYNASVVINEGESTASTSEIFIQFYDVTGYTEYSLNGGALLEIPEDDFVIYTIPELCGTYPVTVTLSNGRDKTATVTKNIEYSQEHKVYYYLNGSLYQEKVAVCGQPVPEVEEPSSTDCEFTGWDGIPETMPHDDLVINGDLRYVVNFDGVDANTGEEIKITSVETKVPEQMVFSLMYNSSNYDGGWADRQDPVIVYTDEEGNSYTYEYENSPLKLTLYGGWYDGVYVENEYDLVFSIPQDLPKGEYTIRVELTVPGGKESNSEVKPIVFVFEESSVETSKPGGSGGGSGSSGSVTLDRSVISDEFYDAAKVVYDLGFMEDIYTNYADNVTREDLALAFVKFAGLEEEAREEADTELYPDLTVGTYLNGCAVLLNKKGLMPAYNDGKFWPDDEVFLADAIMPFADFMGYAPYIEDKGGYPQGYLAAASMIGITENFETDAYVTVTNEELAGMVYGALNGRLMVSEGDSFTTVMQTPFTQYHGYEKYRGTFSVYGSDVTIDGTKYNYDNPQGTSAYETLFCRDNDVADYADNGLTAYVKDGEILCGVPYYSASITVNNNNWQANGNEIPVKFTTVGYTKYSINGSEYAAIPEDGVVKYTLSDPCGSKTLTIKLASTDGKYEASYTKYITLRTQHKLTYMADGEEFWYHMYYCDQSVTAPHNPEKEGYIFVGWDNLPEVMPHGDITVNAVFKEEESEPENPLTFTVTDTTTMEPIADAYITVAREDETVVQQVTSDADGVGVADIEDGKYKIYVLAKGFEPRSFTLEITGDNRSFDVYLNKNPLVNLETSVKEMTKEEMEDAGIDMDSAENKNIYKCTTVLKFTPVSDGGSADITPIEINFDYICDDSGAIIKADPIRTQGKIIYPVAKDIFLIVHSEVSWYKEMFDVELIAANTSVIENLSGVTARIELPEGLSLADMANEEQSLTADMGDILPGNSENVHWYIRGDEEGEYTIKGEVSYTREGGGITEDTVMGFATKDPVTVLGGDAMHLLIKAEKYAKAGQPYKMEYTLTNTSSKTLYDVVLNVLGGKFCEAYSVEEIILNGEILDMDNLGGTFNGGKELKAEEFEPGETLSGVFKITFGDGIDTEEEITYMVKEMYNFTGAGSTAVIPTEIVLVDSVHEHTWNKGVTVIASAQNSKGLRKFTCTSCGEIKYEDIPAGENIGSKGLRAYISRTPSDENGNMITRETIKKATSVSFEVDNFSGEDISGKFVVIFYGKDGDRVGLASADRTLGNGTVTVTVPITKTPVDPVGMKIMMWDSEMPLRPVGVAEDFEIN